jgi:preprotein translocase subunit YajC
MVLFNFSPVLALAPQASSSSGGTTPNPTGQMISFLCTMALFAVVAYFLMIRPQQKRAKEHAQLLKGVKAGDKVVTSGGIIGLVINVKEKTLTLRSADTKLEVTKSAIGEVLERSGESTES